MVVYTHYPLPGIRPSPVPHRPMNPGLSKHDATRRLLWSLLAPLLLGLALASPAAPVNPYEVVVAGEVGAKSPAVQEALRQVAVRATGRRAAAADPALAALYASARNYVLTVGAAGPGRIRVGFDPATIEAALARAGQPIWDRERTQTLVVLPTDGADAARLAEERRDIDRVAQYRGVPVVLPTLAPSEHLPTRLEDLKRGDPASLVELAARYGAEEVLVASRSGTDLSYALYGRIAVAKAGARAEEAVNTLADRLAADAAQSGNQGLSTLTVVVRGIGDVRAYAQARRTLEALSPVRSVTLMDAAADAVRFSVALRGGPEALRRALSGAEHLSVEAGGDEGLALKLTP